MKVFFITFCLTFLLNTHSKVIKPINEETDEPPPPPPPAVQTLDDIENIKYHTKKPIYTTVILYCPPGKNIKIQRFKITERDFSCHNKHIEIYFEYVENGIKLKKGYLTQNDTDSTRCITEYQETSKKCHKIRR